MKLCQPQEMPKLLLDRMATISTLSIKGWLWMTWLNFDQFDAKRSMPATDRKGSVLVVRSVLPETSAIEPCSRNQQLATLPQWNSHPFFAASSYEQSFCHEINSAWIIESFILLYLFYIISALPGKHPAWCHRVHTARCYLGFTAFTGPAPRLTSMVRPPAWSLICKSF